jgi:hypothetical protein
MEIMTKKRKDLLIKLSYNRGIIFGLIIRDGNEIENIDHQKIYMQDWIKFLMDPAEEAFIHNMQMKEILSFVEQMNAPIVR